MGRRHPVTGETSLQRSPRRRRRASRPGCTAGTEESCRALRRTSACPARTLRGRSGPLGVSVTVPTESGTRSGTGPCFDIADARRRPRPCRTRPELLDRGGAGADRRLRARRGRSPVDLHVDRDRAAGGPFGTTIAHGFLTLALVVPMLYEVLPPLDGMMINYGVDQVRFPAPVPSGSRIRGSFRVDEVTEVEGGSHLRISATVECEGSERPVCVAALLVRIVT